MKHQYSRTFGSLALALAMVPPVFATSDSWKTDVAGSWINSANWALGNIPGSTIDLDSPDIATFGVTLTAGRIVTVDANRNIGGLTFSNTSAFGYTLSGGSLKLSNSGVVQSTGATGAHTDTISSAIEIQGDGGAASFTNSSSLATRLLSMCHPLDGGALQRGIGCDHAIHPMPGQAIRNCIDLFGGEVGGNLDDNRYKPSMLVRQSLATLNER